MLRCNISRSFCAVLLGVVLLTTGLVGCREPKKGALSSRAVPVVAEKRAQRLYFSGVVEPIRSVPVTSPIAEGFMHKTYVQYGESVRKGQRLFSLTAPKLAQDYYASFIHFLRAKSSYQEQQRSFAGVALLWKEGAIAKNEYLKAKRQRQDAYVDFLKVRLHFESVLGLLNKVPKQLEALTLGNVVEIKQVMQQHAMVDIRSPISGVMLAPQSTKGRVSGSGGSVQVQGRVVQGQEMARIGDLSGLSIEVQVGEANINRVTPGLSVVVTGDAFPGEQLKGVVQRVNVHLLKSAASGAPRTVRFPVWVAVPTLTESQKRLIHMGMTVQVGIVLPNKARILVPIKAVFQAHGHSMVIKVDPRTQKTHKIVVITGHTTATQVVIERGLVVGDHVLVRND